MPRNTQFDKAFLGFPVEFLATLRCPASRSPLRLTPIDPALSAEARGRLLAADGNSA